LSVEVVHPLKLFPSKIVVNPSSESAALTEVNAMMTPAYATMKVVS
jgi:hypothetical protein